MTLTKSHIVDAVQNQLGFQRSQSTNLIESILEILKKKSRVWRRYPDFRVWEILRQGKKRAERPKSCDR